MHDYNLTLKIIFPFLSSLRIEENGKRQSKHTHHYIKKQICFHKFFIF